MITPIIMRGKKYRKSGIADENDLHHPSARLNAEAVTLGLERTSGASSYVSITEPRTEAMRANSPSWSISL
jgi:hypothetical protein